MRIAVLVKQIPVAEQLRLVDGRIVREGVELETNAYCRRANAKAVELAGGRGEVVVFTLGPASAEDVLREMIACGASRGVHVCDPAFAGSDTLATARALVAAIRKEGAFDLVLCGLNSLDADTGQVGPEVAALLEWPFVAAARVLDVGDGSFTATVETDDGFAQARGTLPAVISTAERLIDPSKAKPEARRAVDGARITRVGPVELGLGPGEVGAAGSPTWVGVTRVTESSRRQEVVRTAAEAVARLAELGAFDDDGDDRLTAVPATGGSGPGVWCFLEPGGPDHAELLGAAADLAASVGGSVTAVTATAGAVGPVPAGFGAWGADRVVVIPAASEVEQWAAGLGDAVADAQPWALLVGGTHNGRVVASTVAARHGWGLTGDAVELEVSAQGRLVAWKPAFGGRLVAAIESRSPVQMVTVRPGVLARRTPRAAREVPVVVAAAPAPARVVISQAERLDDDIAELARARAVIGVGAGVDPAEYSLLEPLRAALGDALLAASRKVTDQGWLPRSRQIGVTGRAIGPRLYLAVGISGKLNHTIGIRNARVVLAVNTDPEAPIWHHADIGVVGDWRDVVPELVAALAERVS